MLMIIHFNDMKNAEKLKIKTEVKLTTSGISPRGTWCKQDFLMYRQALKNYIF